jgi:hypothetical protein
VGVWLYVVSDRPGSDRLYEVCSACQSRELNDVEEWRTRAILIGAGGSEDRPGQETTPPETPPDIPPDPEGPIKEP